MRDGLGMVKELAGGERMRKRQYQSMKTGNGLRTMYICMFPGIRMSWFLCICIIKGGVLHYSYVDSNQGVARVYYIAIKTEE